jgi:hypothetical protein
LRIRKRDISLFFVTLCIAGATALAASRSKSIKPPSQKQPVDFSQYPIADATAPKPTDPKKIAKRKAKSKKYDQYRNFGAGPGIKGSTLYHWPQGFPELPVAQSDAVVLGTVAEARAELTEDESNVYSEFTINISEVLKDDSQQPLSAGNSIVVDRPGGRVKYGMGQMGLFWIQGFGMPRKGGQYVLFIKRGGLDEDYQIITGYEIRQGRVYPLDKSTSSDTNFGIYTNSEEASFLNKIRSAVAQ